MSIEAKKDKLATEKQTRLSTAVETAKRMLELVEAA
jgi:hypothetical protein